MVYKIKNKDLITIDGVSHIYDDASFFINDIDDVKRRLSIKSHIKRGDYFGTLATILDLIKQMTEKEIESLGVKKNKLKTIKQIEKIKKDLIFLQDKYKIVSKK